MSASPVIVNIDDHEPTRYARSRVLRNAGFTVHEGATGQAAMALLESVKPHLILLDVHLPDADGIEISRRVKATSSGASTIVLQISASATTAPQMTVALNSGADAYLAEPVDPDVLVATIRAMLRLRSAEQSLAEANRRLDKLNKELMQSNDDLRHFAFVASHDLQEPLRTITAFTQLLDRSLGQRISPEDRAHMDHVVSAALRMRQLVTDLLTYCQVSLLHELKHSPIPLATALEWATQNLNQLIEESHTTIESEDLPTVEGDAAQLGHVFLNLLGNAIKYRHPQRNPHVRIHAVRSSEANEWTIGVHDNGIGIACQYFDQIFVPFRRLHGPDIAGTGIGLAVCQRIVEAHRGRIWVESELDVGSKFYFSIPANA